MIKLRLLGLAMALAALGAAVLNATACGEGTGVCTGCCGPTGNTYCKDDYTRAECDDWNEQQVNGVSWTFHEGQTCAERGTPATP